MEHANRYIKKKTESSNSHIVTSLSQCVSVLAAVQLRATQLPYRYKFESLCVSSCCCTTESYPTSI